MIPKTLERQKAIELRKNGLSYNEIRQKVKVSKSTLSLWLRSVGLAKRQIKKITDKQREAQKKAIRIIHERRLAKTLLIKNEAAAEISDLTDKERWLMGICLYWAEGTKEKDKGALIQFSNSDPHMVLFFREWLLDFMKICPQDIGYNLYIHKKSKNIADAIRFWSNFLRIDLSEIRLLLKKHNLSPKRKNIGANYVGLIRLVVKKSIDMNRKLSGWINGIIDKTVVIGE